MFEFKIPIFPPIPLNKCLTGSAQQFAHMFRYRTNKFTFVRQSLIQLADSHKFDKSAICV